MKNKLPKNRNPFVVTMMGRKGGEMRSKKNKRLTGKNKQRELLKETI